MFALNIINMHATNIYIYIYTHTCVYIYIYIHINICIYNNKRPQLVEAPGQLLAVLLAEEIGFSKTITYFVYVYLFYFFLVKP